MVVNTVDVSGEYAKNKLLKREDVQMLQEWMEKQPHLPKITELQVIIFLHSCYYSIGATKITIDTFYTVRTHCPEFFSNRNPATASMREAIKVGVYTPLPKLTPEGYRIVYSKLVDIDPNKWVMAEQLKIFDMCCMLWLQHEATAEGHIIVFDMKGIAFGHLAKLGILTAKKFMYYLQEGLPFRLKGLHFVNVVPFIDKIMAIIKPFMKKELLGVFHLHTDLNENFYKFVPKECLPTEYGENAGNESDLHDRMMRNLLENADYFEEDQKQLVDESKRPGKPKNAGELFGVEGTFKKLEID